MTICYFGIYKSDFSRNRTFMKGLRKLGHTVVECRDDSGGLMKYVRLVNKHRVLHGSYDAMIVGYGSQVVIPLARLISRKPIVVDLVGSLEDANAHSHHPSRLRTLKDKIIDRLAIRYADMVFLESEAQKRYFEETFGKSQKYYAVYTGADEDEFRPVSKTKDPEHQREFLVLYRGRLTPESGILHMIKAAEILRSEQRIKFRVIGNGYMLEPVMKEIAGHNLTNVEVMSAFLPEDELVERMCECDLSIGQLENNPRLSRAVPHKVFDSFALGLPYLSGDSPAIREIVTEGKTGFLTPLADPAHLAERIKELSGKAELLRTVSINEKEAFGKLFSSVPLAKQIVAIISVNLDKS